MALNSLADHDVLEAEQMTRVMRTQIDVVLSHGAGVLNADDAAAADLARLCDGQVLFYTQRPQSARRAAHREGRWPCRGAAAAPTSCWRTAAPSASLGTLEALRPVNGFEPDSSALLAAIATAWALDIAPDLIAAGIKTFDYQPAELKDSYQRLSHLR